MDDALAQFDAAVANLRAALATQAIPADVSDKLAHLEQQNALLVAAFKAIRQNKWTGADGVDGYIVALTGGQPLGFEPTFPKAP